MIFDLEKCMADGGKCLAGDRPARVVCTDSRVPGMDGKASYPVVVLVDEDGTADLGFRTAAGECFAGGLARLDLRNLPEFKEVEVTLWLAEGTADMMVATVPGQTVPPSRYSPYGQPVTVRFPKGD